MDFSKIDRGERLAVLGGLLLAASVFMTWYTTGNTNSVLHGCTHGTAHAANLSCSGWQTLSMIRILLLLTAIAPAILAYIVARQHALSWPRGELTAVVAMTAITLILTRGVIIKPGAPSGEIGLGYGWFVALFAGILILFGAIARTRESARVRKPPGVL